MGASVGTIPFPRSYLWGTALIFYHAKTTPKQEKKNLQIVAFQQLGDLFCVDTWIRTKDPHHVKVIL